MRHLAAALLLLTAVPAQAEEELGVGLPAPGFSLKALNADVTGEPWFRLDSLVGEEPDDPRTRVVLLSFFASWCGPCERELPFLVQLDGLYRERGLRVVSISIDTEEPAIEAARRMAAAAGVRHPVLTDRFNVLARRYLGERSPLPSVFLLDRAGDVLLIEKGYAEDASALLLGEVQTALGLQRRTAGPPGGRPAQPAPGAAPAVKAAPGAKASRAASPLSGARPAPRGSP